MKNKALAHKNELYELERLLGFSLKKFIDPIFGLDIVSLDEHFSKIDSRYDCIKCTYKGIKGISLLEYVKEKYGEKVVMLINSLL